MVFVILEISGESGNLELISVFLFVSTDAASSLVRDICFLHCYIVAFLYLLIFPAISAQFPSRNHTTKSKKNPHHDPRKPHLALPPHWPGMLFPPDFSFLNNNLTNTSKASILLHSSRPNSTICPSGLHPGIRHYGIGQENVPLHRSNRCYRYPILNPLLTTFHGRFCTLAHRLFTIRWDDDCVWVVYGCGCSSPFAFVPGTLLVLFRQSSQNFSAQLSLPFKSHTSSLTLQVFTRRAH